MSHGALIDLIHADNEMKKKLETDVSLNLSRFESMR